MSLLALDALRKKIEKLYTDGTLFRNYIEKTETFPTTFKLKKINQKGILEHFDLLRRELETLKALPLTISYETFHFKTLGKQRLPVSVTIENESCFFQMVDARELYKRFQTYYTYIVKRHPSLKALFLKKPFLVLDYAAEWERILRIVDYLYAHPASNLYIRQITLQDIDTKFIEKHKKIIDLLLSSLMHREPLRSLSEDAFEKRYGLKYPLPLVRTRVFDCYCGIEDISLTTAAFRTADFGSQKVFVVENKISFLSFPSIENSMVIFGSGYAVGQLKEIDWLHDKQLYYWGDIDIDGFAILSQLRGYFPQTRSFLMDKETLENFRHLGGTYAHTKTVPVLKNLTADEIEVYDMLTKERGFRLEQEQIPFEEVVTTVASLGT